MSELVAPLIVLVLMVLAAAVVGVLALRKRRAQKRAGSPGQAAPRARRRVPQGGERGTADRGKDLARRPEQLGIRSLTEDERTRWSAAWQGVQSRAEQRPALALSEADAVLDRMLRACGYPVDDPRSPTDVVPGWHANVLASFRAGHALEQVNTSTRSDAEQVRQAMVHFGRAFDAVITDGRPGYPDAPRLLTSERTTTPGTQPGR